MLRHGLIGRNSYTQKLDSISRIGPDLALQIRFGSTQLDPIPSTLSRRHPDRTFSSNSQASSIRPQLCYPRMVVVTLPIQGCVTIATKFSLKQLVLITDLGATNLFRTTLRKLNSLCDWRFELLKLSHWYSLKTIMAEVVACSVEADQNSQQQKSPASQEKE